MQVLKRPVFQYGYFVNDVEAAARAWTRLFGAGPFYVVPHHRSEGYFRYRGTDVQADVSYAFAYCGPVQIQLIAQHDDLPSIYREMYQRGEEGFHHVAILSDTFDLDKQDLVQAGLEPAIEMWSGADVVYFDGRKHVGCFVEMHGKTQVIDDVFSVWKRAHETWDGQTRPLRDGQDDAELQAALAELQAQRVSHQ